MAAETEPEDVVGIAAHNPPAAAPVVADAPRAPALPLYKGGFLLNSFREVQRRWAVMLLPLLPCQPVSEHVPIKVQRVRTGKALLLTQAHCWDSAQI